MWSFAVYYLWYAMISKMLFSLESLYAKIQGQNNKCNALSNIQIFTMSQHFIACWFMAVKQILQGSVQKAFEQILRISVLYNCCIVHVLTISFDKELTFILVWSEPQQLCIETKVKYNFSRLYKNLHYGKNGTKMELYC